MVSRILSPFILCVVFADIAKTENACATFECAMRVEHIEGVRRFLAEGANPNTSIAIGTEHGGRTVTALEFAFWKRNEEIALLLLQSGADPHLSKGNGHTALSLSVSRDWDRVTDFILTEMPGILAAENKMNPLNQAVFLGKRKAVDRLLEAGARIDAVNPMTQLTAVDNALLASNEDLARTLVSRLPAVARLSRQTLAHAVRTTNPGFVKYLSDLSNEPPDIAEPIVSAILNCRHQEQMVAFLIDEVYPENCALSEEIARTLDLEVEWRREGIRFLSPLTARLLLSYLARCEGGSQMEEYGEQLDVSDFEVQHTNADSRISAAFRFYSSFSQGDFRGLGDAIFQFHWDDEEVRRWKADSGDSDLHVFTISLDYDGVRREIASGSDPNQSNRFGVTPIMIALSFGAEDLSRLLFEAGADLRKKSVDGKSTAHYAAIGSSSSITQPEWSDLVDLDAVDAEGRTPLHLIALSPCVSSGLAQLYSYPDDYCVADSDGKTYFDLLEEGSFLGEKARNVAQKKGETENCR